MIIQNMLHMSRYQLGYLGENLARFIIMQKTGLNSIASIPFHGDLILSNGAYLEVKTIRQNKDGTYRATVEKRGSQHLGYSHFVMIQVVHDNDFIDRYIIPSNLITTKRITINERLIPYHENYDLLLQFVKYSTIAA